MWTSKRSWWLAALVLVLAGITGRSWAAGPDCPPGFEPIPSGLACAAVDLAGPDGSFSGLIASVPPSRNCPEGFERPPGVDFCIATRLTFNALGRVPILERLTSRFCPEGFHRQPGGRICVASNLLLQTQTDGSGLLASGDDCPVGFFRPVGSTICVAGTEQAPGTTLEPPVGPHCPRGFFRPPGVTVCVARNIVFGSTAPLDVQVPLGNCPRNWHRPSGVQFCIPIYMRTPASGGAMVRGFIPNPCPSGTHEVWFDVPVYDEKTGWFVVDYIPTRFCVPDDLEPAG